MRSRNWWSLTPADKRTLELLLEGKSNKEIAAELGISRRTAEHHVAEVLEKMGFSRRTKLLAHYLAHGGRWARTGH